MAASREAAGRVYGRCCGSHRLLLSPTSWPSGSGWCDCATWCRGQTGPYEDRTKQWIFKMEMLGTGLRDLAARCPARRGLRREWFGRHGRALGVALEFVLAVSAGVEEASRKQRSGQRKVRARNGNGNGRRKARVAARKARVCVYRAGATGVVYGVGVGVK